MNIYTKSGDSGETSLYGGTRITKDSLRVWCYGTVDEADGVLGVVHASTDVPKVKDIVRAIQRKLFVLNVELAADESKQKLLKECITEDDISYLEGIIDEYTNEFGKMTGFSIPGETVCSALLHVARTVIRRCERHVVALAKEEYVSKDVLKYINRLSDVLFVLGKIEVFEGFVKRVAGKISSVAGLKDKDGWFEERCSILCRAAISESEKLGVPISIAIVDESGTLAYFHRMPGAVLVSVGIAQNKAYTSASIGLPTSELSELASPGGSLFGINTADPKYVIFGGGFPLFQEGMLVGAFGISGASVEEDEQIGKAVLEAFEQTRERSGMEP
jgi:ATP:cob(I)alamin adenosyltransferase